MDGSDELPRSASYGRGRTNVHVAVSQPPITTSSSRMTHSASTASSTSQTSDRDHYPTLYRSDSQSSTGHTRGMIPIKLEPISTSKSGGSDVPQQPPSSPNPPSQTHERAERKPVRVNRRQKKYKRSVYANDETKNDAAGFAPNRISTARYTLLTFIPKNLFEQFRRIGNFYFLVISGLQMISELSPVNPFTSILPLTLILAMVALKDAYEDYHRHLSDEKVNTKRVSVIRGGERKEVMWEEIKVGDICRIHNAEQLPGDLLLLSSSEPNGMAYIETSNLDGESNLKIMQALHVTRGHTEVEDFAAFTGRVDMEQPNRHLYQFDGCVVVGDNTFPISLKQVLLRGCNLRNTEWIYGLVLNAGHETKIMQNAMEVPSKQSRVERVVNGLIIQIFGWLVVICVISAAGLGVWQDGYGTQHAYLHYPSTSSAGVNGVLGFVSFLLLYNVMVPISLYVSIEFVKVFQAWHIQQDVFMYDEHSDVPIKVRTSNLNEDLGHVEYIFCDKTGTLTQNSMEFKMCSIGGVQYGDINLATSSSGMGRRRPNPTGSPVKSSPKLMRQQSYPRSDPPSDPVHDLVRDPTPPPLRLVEDPIVVAETHGDTVTVAAVYHNDGEAVDTLMGVPSLSSIESYPPERRASLVSQGSTVSLFSLLEPRRGSEDVCEGYNDPRLMQAMRNENGIVGVDHQELVFRFIECMTLCHTVIPTQDDDGGIIYEAASPDESALLRAARDSFDHFFCDRSPNQVVVRTRGQNRIYQLLNVMEFNPTRKRMSVIVRTPDDKLVLYMKGADNVVFDRLRRDQPHTSSTMRHLLHFATSGLRTLLFAYRVLDESEYVAWNAQWVQASQESEEYRVSKLDAVAELIETRMILIGASAIEDKLQHGVKETMGVLMEAGIHVWILTGDKQETAINVGFSTQLLSDLNTLIIINGRTRDSVYLQITQALVEYDVGHKDSGDIAVVIDGRSLDYAIVPGQKAYAPFLKLAKHCRSVICCRTSPLQKANVIKMIKDNLNAHTLAIGDGANDVSMIQAADLGVGISGQEGMQAVLASDYAIAQFKFLARLVLVHGQWSLNRIVTLILYSFFKNMAMAMGQFWFQTFNGFSGQTFYDDWQISIYNLVFTSLPIIFLAALDKELEDRTLLRNPRLYHESKSRRLLSPRVFWAWLLQGIWTSLVVFFIPSLTFTFSLANDGRAAGLWVVGTVAFTCLVVIVNIKILIISTTLTWINVVSVVASVVVWFLYLIGYSAVIGSIVALPRQNMYDIIYRMASSPTFWLVLLITPIIALLPEVAWSAWCSLFKPSMATILRNAEGEAKRVFAGVERHTSMIAAPKKKHVQIVMNGREFRHTGYSFSQDVGAADMLNAQHRKRVLPEDLAFFQRGEAVAKPSPTISHHATTSITHSSPVKKR